MTLSASLVSWHLALPGTITCANFWRLFRFKPNGTATSDGGTQKLGNDVLHDIKSIATKVCIQVGRKWNAMFERHIVTSVDGSHRTSFYFQFLRFFEQSSFVNIHLLCYWPTIHNSISKICPKFQVISFRFFKVDELLNEHWAKLCNLKGKIFQL